VESGAQNRRSNEAKLVNDKCPLSASLCDGIGQSKLSRLFGGRRRLRLHRNGRLRNRSAAALNVRERFANDALDRVMAAAGFA